MSGILPRDENRVPAGGFESSSTPGLVLPGQVNDAGQVLVQAASLSGTVAPASTPQYIGQLYVDTQAGKLYFAKGTTNSSDWIITN